MATEQEVREKVKSVILDKLDVKEDQIVDSASFTNDLGVDSLDRTELIMGLEDEFKIEIPETESQKFQTIGDVIAFLNGKQ